MLDVENLRLHYAETLRALAGSGSRRAPITSRAMFDERFVRAWRLYLAGSLAAFTAGDDAAVPGRVRAAAATTQIPWTRADLYAMSGR